MHTLVKNGRVTKTGRRWLKVSEIIQQIPEEALSKNQASPNHPLQWVLSKDFSFSYFYNKRSTQEKMKKAENPLCLAATLWLGLPYEDIYSLFISFTAEGKFSKELLLGSLHRYMYEGRYWEDYVLRFPESKNKT